ncbi:hypothetical protein vseg_016067 [Gypsophila vaccaria]
MAQELIRVLEMMIKVPGMPPPIEQETPDIYADSPFDDSIALVEMPKKYSLPNMKIYDGMTDPQELVAQYN